MFGQRFISLLLLLCLVASFSWAEDVGKVEVSVKTLEILKENLRKSLLEQERLESLLSEKQNLLVKLSQGNSSSLNELKAVSAELTELRKSSESNRISLLLLQSWIQDQEKLLTNLEASLERAFQYSNNLLREHRNQILTVVIVVGGISVALSIIGVIYGFTR